MAGRGTDIKLGEGVADVGGLHVIGSARHDSRRIDRQLRGRCARQGDPGSSRFYISLEDNLMRLFGSDRIVTIMEKFGLDEGEELQHPWLNRSIETAQKRVEQHHFSIRKRTLEYDDVMNKQREVLYGFRKEALLTDTPKDLLFSIVDQEVEARINDSFLASQNSEEPFDRDVLIGWLNSTFPLGFTSEDVPLDPESKQPGDTEELMKKLVGKIENAYAEKEKLEDADSLKWLERNIILEAVDRLWQDHLHAMDHLRSSIGLRAYAQKDPLVEYKQEAYKIFHELMQEINQEILSNMFRSATSIAAFENILASLPQNLIHESIDQFGGAPSEGEQAAGEMPEDMDIQITFKREAPKVGRNDPCPCGSGKKYKKCCGA
jgi:preprotein translocase subunit SecA